MSGLSQGRTGIIEILVEINIFLLSYPQIYFTQKLSFITET